MASSITGAGAQNQQLTPVITGAGRSEKCESFFATSGRELSEKTLSVHVADGAKKVFVNNAESKKVCSRDCSIAEARALFF